MSSARLNTSPVEPVDLIVLPHQVLGHGHVAALERLAALDHLLACLRPHPLDEGEDLGVGGRLVSGEGTSFAMFTH